MDTVKKTISKLDLSNVGDFKVNGHRHTLDFILRNYEDREVERVEFGLANKPLTNSDISVSVHSEIEDIDKHIEVEIQIPTTAIYCTLELNIILV